MSNAAKKLNNIVPIQSREDLVTEYKRLGEEQSKFEAAARKIKSQKESLRDQILGFVKAGNPTQIGRFEVVAREKSSGERVNVSDARKVLPADAIAAFNALVSETKYWEVKVTLIDQVGELMDLAEESDS